MKSWKLMNFTVGQFNTGEPDCLRCKTEVSMYGFFYLLGTCPKPAPISPAWWFFCLPVSWGLVMGAHGVKDLREGHSLTLLERNPLADPAPSGLLHSSPTPLEGGTSEKREMCTSNFNFEVGEMVAGFFLELLLIPTPPKYLCRLFKTKLV